MKCRATDDWSVCQWMHELEDQRDSNNNIMKIVCATTHGNSATCDNSGGSDELDNSASRIRLDASGDTCTVRISKSEAIDSGDWKCVMIGGELSPATA